MASFIVKNIGPHSLVVLGNTIGINAKLDLLTVVTGAQIISSMRNGELYELLQGRMITVTDMQGFRDIGASQDDLDYFSYCGFMQGFLGKDDLKYPFHFNHDGYVYTVGTIDGYVNVNVDGYVSCLITDGYDIAAVMPASTAPTVTDPALVVAISPNTPAIKTGIYNSTTPNLTSTQQSLIELSRRACQFIQASLRHHRRIPLTSGLATSATSLTEGCCDTIRTDLDNAIVYYQAPERDLIASQTGSDWTGAAGWSRSGNIWTHAALGGTGDLEITPSSYNAINVGDTYCVIYTVTISAGTSITAKMGTGAGSARTITGTYVELITAATNGKIIFTPTNDLTCTLDVTTVFVLPGSPPLTANTEEPRSAIKICAIAAAATPATAHTTAKVWGGWYRRANAVEVL